MIMLEDILHEEYEDADGRTVLFRCTECGYTSLSLGGTHGHIEKHRGYTRFNIQIPFTKTSMANVGRLMEYTEVIAVDETEEVPLDEVDM
jgi:hypothetical protein